LFPSVRPSVHRLVAAGLVEAEDGRHADYGRYQPTTAERRSTADRTDNFVSLGIALNRQRAVRSPRAASLLLPTAAPLRYALMLDETTAPIMGVSTAKTSVPGSSTQRDVRSANTPPPTPKTTISLMLNGACPEGWACRGGVQEHLPPVTVHAPRGGPVCHSSSNTGLPVAAPAHNCCNTSRSTSRAPLPHFPTYSLRLIRRVLPKATYAT
jgi:hypothetical protein